MDCAFKFGFWNGLAYGLLQLMTLWFKHFTRSGRTFTDGFSSTCTQQHKLCSFWTSKTWRWAFQIILLKIIDSKMSNHKSLFVIDWQVDQISSKNLPLIGLLSRMLQKASFFFWHKSLSFIRLRSFMPTAIASKRVKKCSEARFSSPKVTMKTCKC